MPVDSQEVLAVAPEVFGLKPEVASLLNSLLPLAQEGFYPALIIAEYLFEPNADGSLKVRLLENTPLAGKAGQGKFLLAQLMNGEVRPLLPAFDPDNPPAS